MIEKIPQKLNKNYSVQSAAAISIAFELGFIIALPIIVLGLAGKWLDHRQGTGYFVFIAIVLAITITSVWVYQRFKFFLEKLEKSMPAKKSNQPQDKEPNK